MNQVKGKWKRWNKLYAKKDALNSGIFLHKYSRNDDRLEENVKNTDVKTIESL